MRAPRLLRSLALPFVLLSLGAGCASTRSSYVHSDAALGRVVVYRNGVAYFERFAVVDDDVLRLHVPADKVDDFLKSLTITDTSTGKPAPVSYPTDTPSAGEGLIEMAIRLEGPRPHRLKLTYVTEAPAWKPSYRVSVTEGGKVNLEASAIVDNTSGEDWQAVKLGVGSSSALSFRFDLRSIRLVERETLRATDLFAQAPPTGGATHGGGPGSMKTVFGDFTDDVLRAEAPATGKALEEGERKSDKKGKPAKQATRSAAPPPPPAAPTTRGAGGAMVPRDAAKEQPKDEDARQERSQNHLDGLLNQLRRSNESVVIEGFADKNDKDKAAASLERANRARENLIRNGIPADRITAVGRGEQVGKNGGFRVVQGTPAVANEPPKPTDAKAPPGDPIGTSHFESDVPMSVKRGSSAMVSILHTDTEGEVVYLYDAESSRGNAQFPFKSVRFKNPSTSQLETGPVSVFGSGKFVGEGMIEPVPAGSTAFIPFALDRQIVVEPSTDESDSVSKIITVQRGVFHTEIQHKKKTSLVFVNRESTPKTVYVRHTVPHGYKLLSPKPTEEKLGEALLFKVEVPGGGKTLLSIEEATPVLRTTDLRSPQGLELIRAFVSQGAAEGPMKARVEEIVKLHTETANLGQQIQTLREQMGEFRQRMDELHGQIVTLRAVKSPNQGLLANLEKKLGEVSDRLSKSTLDLVGLQEKQMIARVKLQDALAELSLGEPPAAK